MANVAQIVVKANTAQAQKGIKGLTDRMGGLKGAAIGVGIAAGAAAVGGIAAFAKSSISAFAQAGDEVQKMALRTGFTTEALSELKHAAELSGASLSSMENGVKRMQRTILDAENGLSTATDAFEMLGIEMADVEGKTPEEQFTLLSGALADVEDASRRSALAQQVFGRAGTQLLPMLAAGKDGLAAMRQEAHDLGIVFDQDAANSAAEYQDSLTKLKGAFQGIQFAVGKALVPVLGPVREKFPGRIRRLVRRGRNEEEIVVADLKAIGLDIGETGDGQRFLNLGKHVGGSVDGIIESGVPGAIKTRHILEIKTHNKRSFDDLEKKGVQASKPMHWAQMQIYMLGTKINRALYVAVCKDDDRLYTERVKYDAEAAKNLLERGRRIATTERIPVPISTDASWYQCKFCPAHSFCHKEKLTQEVNCRTCAHATPEDAGT